VYDCEVKIRFIRWLFIKIDIFLLTIVCGCVPWIWLCDDQIELIILLFDSKLVAPVWCDVQFIGMLGILVQSRWYPVVDLVLLLYRRLESLERWTNFENAFGVEKFFMWYAFSNLHDHFTSLELFQILLLITVVSFYIISINFNNFHQLDSVKLIVGRGTFNSNVWN
jgi:hypothetical protein